MQPTSISEDPDRAVSLRLALDQVVISESRFAAGERGPDAHVHHGHADCFYVIEGTLVLELADGERRLPAGTWALVPPGVVHAFRADADGARYLNLHAPGAGFDRYLRTISGRGGAFAHNELARFDQHPPPAGGGLDPSHVLVRSFATDAPIEKPGERGLVLATADDTRGAIGLVERIVEPGANGPPLHVHDRTSDVFLVLEGVFAVQVDDTRRELTAGELLLAAPGTVHGRTEAVGGPARLLNLLAPGGLEAVYVDPAAAAGADFRLVQEP